MRRLQTSGGAGALRAALAIGALALAAPAIAIPVSLTDGVATVDIDPGAGGALSAWTVNGAAHVREQSFYWRVGAAGGEASFGALLPGAVLASDGDGDGAIETLVLGFSDFAGRFTVEARWSLAGSPPGGPLDAATSTLTADVTIVNTSASALDLSLFQYTDADLFGSFADDTAAFAGANGGSFQDGSGLASWDASWSSTPDAIEASIHSALLASLGDGLPTVLSGVTAAGPGDVVLGVGWRTLLDPGASFVRSQVQRIGIAQVPEPGVGLLFGAGLAVLAANARNRMGGRRS